MKKPMKVIVAGGTGFIGAQLVPLLLERECKILVLCRIAPKSASHPALSFIECNLQDISKEARQKIADFGADACVHLAWQGIPDYSPENCHRNFQAAFQLFQLVLKSGCKKILSAGSCWEYGELRGAVRESDQAKDLSIFAAYKTSTRLVLESLCKTAGATPIWARIFFVYGPGQRAEALIPSTMRKIQDRVPIEIRSPNAQNDFIYVGDVARAMRALLENAGASGVYNLGSGIPYRVGNLVQDIHGLLGSPQKYEFTPEERPGESFWADNRRLTQEIGFTPEVDLQAGLALVSRAILGKN